MAMSQCLRKTQYVSTLICKSGLSQKFQFVVHRLLRNCTCTKLAFGDSVDTCDWNLASRSCLHTFHTISCHTLLNVPSSMASMSKGLSAQWCCFACSWKDVKHYLQRWREWCILMICAQQQRTMHDDDIDLHRHAHTWLSTFYLKGWIQCCCSCLCLVFAKGPRMPLLITA